METRRASLKARPSARGVENGQTIVGTPDQYQFLQSGFLGSGVMFSGKFVTSSCNAPASRSN